MDLATIQLADTYDKIKGDIQAVRERRTKEVAAEQARLIKYNKLLLSIGDEESKLLGLLGKAGEAKLRIDQSLPQDIRQGLDAALSEIRPHEEACAAAELHLKHQKDHAEKTRGGLDPKDSRDKYDLGELDRAVAAAESRVKREKANLESYRAKVARFEGLRAAYFKDLRETALQSAPKKKDEQK